MKKRECLIITLPEELTKLPIQIIRSSEHKRLIFETQPINEDMVYADNPEKKYVLIWRQKDYLKISIDEIMWIEADGSYITIHLTYKRSMTVSFHLAVIEKQLPETDFMRIHRSYVVNLKHVVSLTGNCLRVDNTSLIIGREYREHLLDRFIFLGVRRNKSK